MWSTPDWFWNLELLWILVFGIFSLRVIFPPHRRRASGEMADTPDLGSGPARGGGSSPLSRTIFDFECQFDVRKFGHLAEKGVGHQYSKRPMICHQAGSLCKVSHQTEQKQGV